MVDALVSGASVERRVGSTPILGTQNDRPQGRVELKGSLAQLAQSICLTSRGSAVRIRQLPQSSTKQKDVEFSTSFLFYIPPWQIYLTKEECKIKSS